MLSSVRHYITRQRLWVLLRWNALSIRWRANKHNADRRVTENVLSLLRQMPAPKAIEWLDTAMCRTDGRLAYVLAEAALKLFPEQKQLFQSALKVCRDDENHDRRLLILWRAVRSFPEEPTFWQALLDDTLRYCLWCTPNETSWAQAQLRRAIAEVPPQYQHQEWMLGYTQLVSLEGRRLIEVWDWVRFLWQQGYAQKAREGVRLLWRELTAGASTPEPLVRAVGWSVLGLGMFRDLASERRLGNLFPYWLQVAQWFEGEPLRHTLQALLQQGDPLMVLTHWTEELVHHGRTPWRIYLRMNRWFKGEHYLIAKALFSAGLGWKTSALRERLRQWRSDVRAVFVPYEHYLCVATARLGWTTEALLHWNRIQAMGVDYPRLRDLRHLMRSLNVLPEE